jgi:hypothetical protein
MRINLDRLIPEVNEAATVAWLELRKRLPSVPDDPKYREVFRYGFVRGHLIGYELSFQAFGGCGERGDAAAGGEGGHGGIF